MISLIIIEDEQDILEGIVDLIDWDRLGYDLIDTCKNGLEGYQSILKHKPQLVITDIKMPKMDGLKVIEKVKATDLETKFIILTGYETFEYAKTAINLGAIGFVSKISLFEDLTTILTDVKASFENRNQFNSRNIKMKNIILEHYLSPSSPIIIKDNYFQSLYFGSIGIKIDQLKPSLTNDVLLKIENCFSEDEQLFFIRSRNNILCTIFYSDEEETLQNKQTILLNTLSNTLKELITKKTAHYYLAVGRIFKDITGCLKSLNDIDHMMSRRKLHSNDNILYYSYFDETNEVFSLDSKQEIENEILLYIDSHNYQLAKEHINKWVEIVFSNHKLSNDKLKHICISFLALIVWKIEDNFYNNEKTKQFRIDILDLSEETDITNIQKTFLRIYDECLNVLLSSLSNKSNYEIMEIAKHYIDNHILDNISLKNIAFFSYMSPSYFSSLFTKYYNETFSNYVNRLKMNKAYELLEAGKNVNTVAELLGYTEVKSFRRRFKEYFNTNPSNIKKG